MLIFIYLKMLMPDNFILVFAFIFLCSKVQCGEISNNTSVNSTSANSIKVKITSNTTLCSKKSCAFNASAFYRASALAYMDANGLSECRAATCGRQVQLNATVMKSKGFWAPGCGDKKYFFAYKKIELIETWPLCCSLGLIPASITTREEINCLASNLNNLTSNELKDAMFFTSVLDARRDRKFISCVTQRNVSADMWMKGEPNNLQSLEACTALVLTNKSVGFMDTLCQTSIVKKNAICELKSARNAVSSQYLPHVTFMFTTLKMYECEFAICAKQVELTKNTTLLKVKGQFVQDCGAKWFFFTNKKTESSDMWSVCCSVNMIPISMEDKQSLSCLHAGLNKSGIRSGKLWTGQQDARLDRRFVSCASGRPVSAQLFAQREPNNEGNREACVAVTFNVTSAALMDLRCGDVAIVVCESSSNSSRELLTQLLQPDQVLMDTPAFRKLSSAKQVNVSMVTKAVKQQANTPTVKSPIKIVTKTTNKESEH